MSFLRAGREMLLVACHMVRSAKDADAPYVNLKT